MKIKIKILILNLIAVPQGVSTISLSLSRDICLRAAIRKSAKYQGVGGTAAAFTEIYARYASLAG